MKHIIFDLDETIGTFYECSLLYEALGHTLKKKVKNIDFFKVIDTFPEFFRPGIFDIFNYIKDIKDIEINLYTNNPYKLWVYLIKSYIENKIGKDARLKCSPHIQLEPAQRTSLKANML